MIYNIEELLKQLTEKLSNYINDKKYVYKTCGVCIVVLEKLEDTITNENRFNVSQIGDNKLYAKYRADKLLVRQIINKYDLTKCETIISNYCKNTKYKINETVYPDDFDDYLENVCSSGIHYFLNLKRAFYYNLKKKNINGEYLDWHDNGQMSLKFNYINEKINGEWLTWHVNGQIYVKCNYVDGNENGEYLSWYTNGQMCIKCIYIDGVLNGEYLEWHENGQMWEKYIYIDGKINGECLSWHKNGQMWEKCIYIDGKINGEYLSWHENGQICEKINCSFCL